MLTCQKAGVLECWSAGVLECWSAGVLECWSAGVLECWSAGVLECWSGWSAGVLVGKLECWSVGVLECWSVGVLECWSVGVLTCWNDILLTYCQHALSKSRSFTQILLQVLPCRNHQKAWAQWSDKYIIFVILLQPPINVYFLEVPLHKQFQAIKREKRLFLAAKKNSITHIQSNQKLITSFQTSTQFANIARLAWIKSVTA